MPIDHIAIYMGGEFKDGAWHFKEKEDYMPKSVLTTSELKYTSDWTWLMDVVGRIEKNEHIAVNITNNRCIIMTNSGLDGLFYTYESPKIVAVFKTVAKYIVATSK